MTTILRGDCAEYRAIRPVYAVSQKSIMKSELARQYEIALTMLKGVIDETDEDIWHYSDDSKDAAWHIAYHAVYYANIYCSPSEEEVKRWDRQSRDCHILGPTPWPPRYCQ